MLDGFETDDEIEAFLAKQIADTARIAEEKAHSLPRELGICGSNRLIGHIDADNLAGAPLSQEPGSVAFSAGDVQHAPSRRQPLRGGVSHKVFGCIHRVKRFCPMAEMKTLHSHTVCSSRNIAATRRL